MTKTKNDMTEKTRLYTPEDFDVVPDYLYDKFHCIRYTYLAMKNTICQLV